MSLIGDDEARASNVDDYRLDEQVGFLLRQVQQRHTGIFVAAFGDELTPTQWAALAKLHELGSCSQNLLGRLIAVDAATTKFVVQKLIERGYLTTRSDPTDRRRLILSLTPDGAETYARLAGVAQSVSETTLEPLTARERQLLLALLGKMT